MKLNLNYILLIICFFLISIAQANQKEIDSLYSIINSKEKPDSLKVEAEFALIWYYYNTDINTAIKICESATKKSEELGFEWGMSGGYAWFSYLYRNMGYYDKALEYIFKSLKLREKLNEKTEITATYSDIGSIYEDLNNYPLALEYYKKEYKLANELNDSSLIVNALSDLARHFYYVEKYDTSLSLYLTTSNYHLSMGDSNAIAILYNNIANLYEKKEDFNKALYYFHLSIDYSESKQLAYRTCYNLARIYYDLGDIDKAYYYNQLSLDHAKKVNDLKLMSSIYHFFHEIYKERKDFKQALKMHTLYSSLKDSIYNDNTKEVVLEQTLKHDFEKKEVIKEAEHEKQMAVAAEAERRQKIVSVSIGLGLFMSIVFAFIIFKRLKITREQKNIISEQNEELNQFIEEIEAQRDQIDEQNKDLEHKNSHIMSSIQYAKRIQEAILPSDELVRNNLAESFVLYKPKDIVSGDFYWMESIGQKVFWAAVDCTGHGVPGAFMSILGANGLKKIVSERHIYQPAEILTHLTEHVISSIKETKDGEEVKDGMDISLCCWDKEHNTLEWAGAYNPLFIVREAPIYNLAEKSNFHPFDPEKESLGGLYDVKATKRPIGRFKRKNIPDFENHTISLQQGDCIYVFTDGFADQFGGEDGSKYTTRKMREFVIKIYKKPMQEQLILLEQEFENWRGKEEQLDDICIFGVKV